VGGICLPTFQFFVFLIKLGEEFLAFSRYFVGFSLDHRVLLDSFCRLDDDLRFHVDLSVLIFHDDHSGLGWEFGGFNLRESGLISCLLYCIIGRVRSSVESG
jgi:hypothetical protein